MKILSKTLYGTLVVALLLIAGFFVATLFPLPGNFEVKIVKSGSMEPAIPTGALVVIKPQAAYVVGDVITFGEDSKTKVPTTHRIVGIDPPTGLGQGALYTTKGDANEEADPKPVANREVVGKVLLAVPYAGFVLDSARRPWGFALLVGLPALLIILDELLNIITEVARLRRKKVRVAPAAPKFMSDIRVVRARPSAKQGAGARTTLVMLTLLTLLGGTISGSVGATMSYFTDVEYSLGNVLGAGEWGLPPQPSPLLDDSPQPFFIVGEVQGEQTDALLLEPPAPPVPSVVEGSVVEGEPPAEEPPAAKDPAAQEPTPFVIQESPEPLQEQAEPAEPDSTSSPQPPAES